jgi:hypothetical protein
MFACFDACFMALTEAYLFSETTIHKIMLYFRSIAAIKQILEVFLIWAMKTLK